MDVFQGPYSTYYFMLCITGLWPFDNSIFTKIQRTIFSIIMICCLVVQLTTLAMTELTMKNILITLTFSGPLILFFLRYIGFIISFPTVRILYESLQNDYNTIKNPNEMKILADNLNSSRRLYLMLLGVCCAGFVLTSALILFPIMLEVIQPQDVPRFTYLKSFGFFVDQKKYINIVSLHLLLTIGMGLATLSCTEGTLTVIAYYTCGLFKITSYRVRNIVEEAANRFSASQHKALDKVNIRDAVIVHERCINLIDTLVNGMKLPYLAAISMVVLSFIFNMYRFYLALITAIDVQELLLSGMIFSTHLIIMFVNNHMGQMLINDSVNVFYETYDSMWYYVPLRMQKMVLILMQRSSIECTFNLSGLFIPCYQGFSTMMSTSFSYFTVLHSAQSNE